MDGEQRFQKLRAFGVECSDENRLRELAADPQRTLHIIDGFEPSGRMTIAHGLLRAIQAYELLQLNCKFTFVVGDWFAVMNNKLNGDMKKIGQCAKFMTETWRSIPKVGPAFVDAESKSQVQFIVSSEFINKNASNYWIQTLDIARRCSVENVTNSAELMGIQLPSPQAQQQKAEPQGEQKPAVAAASDEGEQAKAAKQDAEEDVDPLGKLFLASQIFYPCLQLADLFALQADVGHFGMDQKAIVPLMNTYTSAVKKDQTPVILLHPLLSCLAGNNKKMSSSDPTTAIFMDDLENEVTTKVKKAFCAEKNIENNPVLELVKFILLPFNGSFEVARDDKNGGNKVYTAFEQIEADFKDGSLHPSDLKPAVSKALNVIMNPVREHFKKNQQMKQLAEAVKKLK